MFPEDHILKNRFTSMYNSLLSDFMKFFGWYLNKRVGHRGKFVTDCQVGLISSLA